MNYSPRNISFVFIFLSLLLLLSGCGPEAKPNMDPEGKNHKDKEVAQIVEISATPESFSASLTAKLNKDTVLSGCKFIIDGVGEISASKAVAAFSATAEELDYETSYQVKAVALKGEKEISSTCSFKTQKHPFNEDFWSLMLKVADKDKDGKISRKEALAVNEISLVAEGLTSVYGLEFFPNVSYIHLASNALTEIDLTKNTNLSWLEVNGQPLKRLDISKNLRLSHLSAGGNSLESLDVSANVALKSLYVQDNRLSSIDVSKLTGLQILHVGINNLTELDLSNNLQLTEVNTNLNPNLKVVWLKTGQTITDFAHDSWTEIRYK